MTNEIKKIHIDLTDLQKALLHEFADIILEGTVEKAVTSYEIIFDKPLETEEELAIFKALCEEFSSDNPREGIQGVIL